MYSILLWFTRCSLPRPFIWERSFSTSTSRLTNLLSGLFSRSIVVGILLRHFFVTFSIRLTSNATSSLSYPIESSILCIFAFKGESCFWIYSLIWLSKSENCSCIWVLNSVSFSYAKLTKQQTALPKYVSSQFLLWEKTKALYHRLHLPISLKEAQSALAPTLQRISTEAYKPILGFLFLHLALESFPLVVQIFSSNSQDSAILVRTSLPTVLRRAQSADVCI